MRISEALSLRFQDITAEGLVIRETKFRKSRLVWLHETVAAVLEQYLLRRRKCASGDDHLFVSRRGGKLGYAIAAETFQEVLKAVGIRVRPGGPKPRLHDLRHYPEFRTIPSNRLPKPCFQGIWSEILGIVRGTLSSAMPGLMETPHHHFFDDRTDAAALDALIRGRFATLVNTKTTARHRPDDKLLRFLKYL